jgi:hypothetical protein
VIYGLRENQIAMGVQSGKAPELGSFRDFMEETFHGSFQSSIHPAMSVSKTFTQHFI